MIVSHKHRFIYIKTYKTASTSIEACLSSICGEDDIITPASEPLMKHREGRPAQNWRLDHPLVPKRPLIKRLLRRPERNYHPSVGYYEHMPAWRIRAYIGEEIWARYYKFTFERNPWDRQVSWYHYKTKSKSPRPSFATFNTDKRRAWVENHDLYTMDGEVVVDFLGQYENLKADFDSVLEAVGLRGKVELPVTNTSPDRAVEYRSYYNEAETERVRSWYRPEIDLFGYEF